MPGKPTRDEVDQRIELTASLLSRRLKKGEIKRLLKGKYNVTARCCERYLSRARRLLLKRSRRPKEVHISEAQAIYEQTIREADVKLADSEKQFNEVLTDPDSTRQEKLQARRDWNRLLLEIREQKMRAQDALSKLFGLETHEIIVKGSKLAPLIDVESVIQAATEHAAAHRAKCFPSSSDNGTQGTQANGANGKH
jgi:hypothetical protein